ncbi:organic hydroperoxide resistance protein [Jatrophihabitans cynanchi]|jgi:Ohr subfamily peroxiredoxin|uniref:Organic hydroperoxide resistance protein n=1 Tax=Jatrophihabitans cynanchi TaxID=2944128 RepID=A0ABY7JX46_9ACTN|nr:organic hydroperoxide resistance protein [Jatrophihabitans sp. SB3-54]WAX55476.1 organic hydroperoxide resistance protein [Jatrophihabitans sp. SB3-54]
MSIKLTKVAYTTSAEAHGGRAGHVKSADGIIDLDLAQPGTSSEPKANPETLFAAGYSACFQGALANRAKTQGIDTADSTVTAEVSFGPSEDGGFGLAVELKVNIPGVDAAKARELVELAHEFCPYSKATRGNIDVTLTVV